MASKATGQGKAVVVEDDYENDEFDAYEEDFEDDPKPVTKSSIQSKPSSKSDNANINDDKMKMDGKNSMNDVLQSLANENSATMEGKLTDQRLNADAKKPEMKLSAKTAAKVSANVNNDDKVDYQPTTASKRESKYRGSMSLSMEGSLTLDPRYRRLTKLTSSGVLDMQEEKFLHANILPTTKHDLYNRQIRSQNPTIRQTGVPGDLEMRDIEVGTDEIVQVDKEMQFCYGDDTTFFNVIKTINESKQPSKENKAKLHDILLQNQPQISRKATDDSVDTVIGKGSQLLDFLQKSSRVMEHLIDESSEYYGHLDKKSAHQESKSRDSLFSKGIFQEESSWQALGHQAGDGANELIRARATVVVRYSELQPFLLLTAHPPPLVDVADDLRPFKSLYALWEVNNPAAPVFILESQGSPTCAAFSRSQTYLVLAGTAEGCLYMWDLRESAAHHKDRDAIDLKIERGIRKPCYSTHFMLGDDSLWQASSKAKKGSASLDDHGSGIQSHCHPIVQIESFGDLADMSTMSSSVSQFISLDLSG
jgi:hypothetical protein